MRRQLGIDYTKLTLERLDVGESETSKLLLIRGTGKNGDKAAIYTSLL